MRSKILISYLFLVFSSFTYLPADKELSSISQSQIIENNDTYIQALASLLFYIEELKENLKSENSSSEEILFSHEEVDLLWEKASQNFNECSAHSKAFEQQCDLKRAYQLYEETISLTCSGLKEEALSAGSSASNLLHKLWEESIETEETSFIELYDSYSPAFRIKNDPNIENNPHIPSKAKKEMGPYLISLRHPMRNILDDLCLKKRVTLDKKAFYQAGFRTIDKRPRSYIRVANHKKMPGYLVKAYLDTELKEKFNKPSWQWLVRRCEGAKKIKNIIQKKRIHHFVVADKWIYCLPSEPSPPNDPLYTRHLALLLVTDMDLAPRKLNYHAWYNYITKEHLEELYVIISRAKGSSYRPDNIAYTNKGKFAFIDTEYPSKGPDFKRIRPFLNPEMCEYWDQLIKNGGYSSWY